MGADSVGAVLFELEGKQPGVWEIDLLNPLLYEGLAEKGFSGVTENAIVATDLSWAIMISSEYFAIFVGSECAVACLQNRMEEFSDESTIEMLSEWRQSFARSSASDDAWVRPLVRHVMGEAHGDRLLARSGWV
ncbi:MAG: hypothetical protein IT303_02290 [Dehalococcoidia bacterium]|nr:hypothetical protein [Dehalococcoidia bacterium]